MTTEMTTADMCWRWLMSDSSTAHATRRDLARYLREKYAAEICNITTRMWLDPLINFIALGSPAGMLDAGCRCADMLCADYHRFIDGDRAAAIWDIEQVVNAEWAMTGHADIVLKIAVGMADAKLYSQGVCGEVIELPQTAWVEWARRVVAEHDAARTAQQMHDRGVVGAIASVCADLTALARPGLAERERALIHSTIGTIRCLADAVTELISARGEVQK